ncbi:MAG: aspartate aminotransferase family protein [Thermodesulfobacteriota bacterium]|nr:aspartate aminotransferase family protein [Thermodesulfobacteriota bacterium]
MDIFEKWESEIRGYCRAYPTVFASAKNARIVDEAGKSYIDFFAGAGVLNFGHNNERMKKALMEFIQSDGVAQGLDMYTTTKRDFISRFAETVLVPRNMDYKLQFTGPTGSNAVEAALKLARRVTSRQGVVAFSHGFHGMTLGSLACTANAYFRNAAGVPLGHVTHLPFDGDKGLEQLEAYAEELADSSSGIEPPAAFIVEVIQAEGGVRIATEEWLKALENLARQYGSFLIIDEIQVGCGRTGSYFSFDDIDIDPDIICLAKGIGGYGIPLAMNLVKPGHDTHWSPGEHTGTFRGQGMSFASGTVALSYFKDDSLMKDVRIKGEHINASLKDIASAHDDYPLEVRGKGMIQALDMKDGKLAKKIQTLCFEKGMLIGPCGTDGQVLKLIPPLIIGDEDLKEGLDILKQAVTEAL